MFGNTTMAHSVRAHNEAAQLMGFPIMPESLRSSVFVGASRHGIILVLPEAPAGFCFDLLWVEPRRHGRGLYVGVPDGKRSFLCEEGRWLQQVMLKLAKMAAKISDELRV